MYLLSRLQAGRISRSRTGKAVWECSHTSPGASPDVMSQAVSLSDQRISTYPPALDATHNHRPEFCAPATGQCSLAVLATSQGVHDIGTKSPPIPRERNNHDQKGNPMRVQVALKMP